MSAGKAQAKPETIFELKGTAQVVVFNFGVGKHRDADTRFNVGFDGLTGKLVHQHRRE
ncbi:hypothetical protein D3C87_1978980 [compost metagenome]